MLSISPTSGSGNATVNISAGINPGRLERSNVIRGVAGNNAASDEYSIYEDPMPTSAAWLPASVNPQISGNGGQVILQIGQQGTNSRGISSISIGASGGYTPAYQCQYSKRDGTNTWTNFTPGIPIPGDPGATWVYDIRILVTVAFYYCWKIFCGNNAVVRYDNSSHHHYITIEERINSLYSTCFFSYAGRSFYG